MQAGSSQPDEHRTTILRHGTGLNLFALAATLLLAFLTLYMTRDALRAVKQADNQQANQRLADDTSLNKSSSDDRIGLPATGQLPEDASLGVATLTHLTNVL